MNGTPQTLPVVVWIIESLNICQLLLQVITDVVLLTQAYLLSPCQFSLISLIDNGWAGAEVSLKRQQHYDQCHSQRCDIFEHSALPVDAFN